MSKIKLFNLLTGITGMMVLIMIGAIAGYEKAILPPIWSLVVTGLLILATWLEAKYVDILTKRRLLDRKIKMRRAEAVMKKEMEDINYEE